MTDKQKEKLKKLLMLEEGGDHRCFVCGHDHLEYSEEQAEKSVNDKIEEIDNSDSLGE